MYEREWTVFDSRGEEVVLGVRGPKVFIDLVTAENGLLVFDSQGPDEFGEAYAAAREHAKANAAAGRTGGWL